ncbi:YIP1 family protein [Candidatus Moduliflexota bacterium]
MICPNCYHDIPALSTQCPACGESIPSREALPDPSPAPDEAPEPKSCPWEERERLGTFAALGETLQKSLFSPSAFFASLPPSGKMGAALLYAIIVGTIGAAAALLWQRVAGSPNLWVYSDLDIEIPHVEGYVWYVALAAMPLIIVISTLFRSAVLHISLLVLGGANESYSATLKTVCYAYSANAFNAFPLCGSVIAWFWRVVLIVTGLAEVHRISTGRAFIAWLLPFIILSCIAGVTIAAVLATLLRHFPALHDAIAI